MRIIAGTYRSRVLKSLPGDQTRPTADKIKEAIYSRIGPYFDGGVMLDLFGGSGGMGLEALSRGMEHVVFCDHHGLAMKTIKENIRSLDVYDQCTCMKMDYHRALQELSVNKCRFDLIFLDPPYRKQKISEILYFIEQHDLLKENGDIVCESLKEDVFEDTYGSLVKVREITYGITRITYYKRREGE